MGVGEARAAKVRHRVGLAPHHVVENPEFRILQQRADAEDVVIAADHPDGAVVLQHAPRLGEPVAGEVVIDSEAVKLVPRIVDRIDPPALGPEQVAAELEVIGRIGEDHVDRLVGQRRHFGDAVALNDGIERQHARRPFRSGPRMAMRLLHRQYGNHAMRVPLFDHRVSQAGLAVKRARVNAGRPSTGNEASPMACGHKIWSHGNPPGLNRWWCGPKDSPAPIRFVLRDGHGPG